MSKRRNSNGKRSKKKSRKPRRIDVAERLREIFEGHKCWECGAPANRLKPYRSPNLPKELKPYNFYCNNCHTSTKPKLEDKDYESLIRVTYHEQDAPDFEGADPWLLIEDEEGPKCGSFTSEYEEYLAWLSSQKWRKKKKAKIRINGKVYPWYAYTG